MMVDDKEVNRQLTAKLIHRELDKGTILRYEKAYSRFADFADKDKPLLDVGARDGVFLDILTKHGFKDVYGIDISPEAVEIMKKKGYKCHVDDAQELKLSNTYGTIVLSHCLEHCAQVQKVVDNMYDLLEEGGIIYVEVPLQPKEPVPTVWAHFYCFESLEDLLSFFHKDKWVVKKSVVENKAIRVIFEKI